MPGDGGALPGDSSRGLVRRSSAGGLAHGPSPSAPTSSSTSRACPRARVRADGQHRARRPVRRLARRLPADPGTTGQVMEFRVMVDDPTDGGQQHTAGPTWCSRLPDPAEDGTTPRFDVTRDLALLEEESALVCVTVADAVISYDITPVPPTRVPAGHATRSGGPCPSRPRRRCSAPTAAAGGVVQLWDDPIATNPTLDTTETWELWNWTADAHPIHLHLVKFKVVDRQAFDPLTGALLGAPRPPEATEAGWKDTVIAYPGEVTTRQRHLRPPRPVRLALPHRRARGQRDDGALLRQQRRRRRLAATRCRAGLITAVIGAPGARKPLGPPSGGPFSICRRRVC